MLRTVGPQGSLFELLLPAGMRVLSGELAEIDGLLDDDRYFRPFRPFFDPVEGRPSIPIETYLRLMFLKYRYDLGYERLCVQVNDSLSWRRFCRIGLEASVPDESTIRKITRRCGPELIEALNGELLDAAHQRRQVSGGSGAGRHDGRRGRHQVSDRLGAVDGGDLSDRVAAAAAARRRSEGRLHRSHRRGASASALDRSVAATPHRRRQGGGVGDHRAARRSRRRVGRRSDESLAVQGSPAAGAPDARRSRRARRAHPRVIDQARCRVNGDQPDGATRLVSLHEPDARPIRKGRLGKPVEFGYKAQVVDNADGIIVDHSVHIGNPSDNGLLRPAIERSSTRPSESPRRWSPPIAATGTRPSKPT